MHCSHACASVTFHNTLVSIHVPKPKHILSFFITSKPSGWKNYERRLSELSFKIKCWTGQHGSSVAFKTSNLWMYYGPPTATYTSTHSSHQPCWADSMQQALKHAETPAVFTASQQPVRSSQYIANILKTWFKYSNVVPASCATQDFFLSKAGFFWISKFG